MLRQSTILAKIIQSFIENILKNVQRTASQKIGNVAVNIKLNRQ